MERGEELMELNHAALDRNKEAFDRNKEAFDRNTKAFHLLMASLDRHEKTLDRHEKTLEEHTTFVREMNLRNEKVVQQIVRDHEDFMADLRASDDRSQRRTDAITARMEEVTKEQRAQREALLRVIDRLPPAEAA
jgi:hypothetical protein